MASLKAIRTRIASVRNTQKITKAMKMVAAAKLRRAQDAAIASRPYAQKLERMVANVVGRLPDGAHRLLTTPDAQGKELVLLITSDRGLCGGYNSNLGKAADALVAQKDRDLLFVTVGRKGADLLKRRAANIDSREAMPTAADALELARKLARSVEERFVAGEFSAVHLVYSHFKSAISQVPTVEQILPLPRTEAEESASTDYLFEPGPDQIVNYLLPRLVEVRILHGLLEAGASEQAARMAAMDSATRNASEMISRLTLEMNRARQAAITKELMEIIGGAEALNG